MRRNTLGSELSPAEQALLNKPVPGLPQPHNMSLGQDRKDTTTQSGYSKQWATKTIRLPRASIKTLERLSGMRKPERQYPWKVQDIVHIALEEYFQRQGLRDNGLV